MSEEGAELRKTCVAGATDIALLITGCQSVCTQSAVSGVQWAVLGPLVRVVWGGRRGSNSREF